MEKINGFFYNSDGDLIYWYSGYGDPMVIIEYRSTAIGFVETESVNTSEFKYDIESGQIVSIT